MADIERPVITSAQAPKRWCLFLGDERKTWEVGLSGRPGERGR